MATKAQVRDRAATDLGRLALGQSLPDPIKVRIESAYDEVYADLKDEGLAVWASTDEVPTNLVPHVVALVADNCLNTFAVSSERYARIKAAESIAKREIRRIVTPQHIPMTTPEDF